MWHMQKRIDRVQLKVPKINSEMNNDVIYLGYLFFSLFIIIIV